ncbi:Fosmidomycin resistance protein [gamma proteobacterium HdN1]|nr:Fosmidomycin resistance protein [gamma proteobacterium HdN1]
MNPSASLATMEGTPAKPTFKILGAISTTHLINDMMQSVLLALYPVLQGNFKLSFVQIGFITVAFQFSASLLQPIVGRYTDKQPRPYSLPFAMGFTMAGLVLLSVAWSYPIVLLSAVLIGMGSSVFHPESSRVARMASGGQHGLAQSIFQVGGQMGTAIGPLLAAAMIVPMGQPSVALVALAAFLGIVILLRVSRWYADNLISKSGKASLAARATGLATRQIRIAMLLLLILMLSKFLYLTSLQSYLTFYLMHHFGVGVQTAQYCLFVLLAGAAVGTIIGGPIGDRIGRKRIILGSILGVAPFTLALPFVGFHTTVALIFIIGLIISSAFPAIVVYGQELVPGKTGAISGLFFGLAFGIAGIGAAALGMVADRWSVELVYHICAYLPLLGVVAFLLPDMRKTR